jgi:aspartyl-tRNA(Asn)/glutamyl-tRNA(Gln) amidotransferase subunit A
VSVGGLDVADLSLVEAAEAVHQGEVSAVALLEACLSTPTRKR